MLISKDLVFIAVAKTGSVSVENLFEPYAAKRGPKHQPIRELYPHFMERHGNELETDWDRVFKFAIVRNPWSRLFSLYNYHQKRKYRDTEGRFRYLYSGNFTFNDWILEPESPLYAPTPSGRNATVPQLFYVSHANGDVPMNFIGKTESLTDDIRLVVQRLGFDLPDVPHDNKSSKISYRDVYSQAAIDKVGIMMESDIEAFGYTFDGHKPATLGMVSDVARLRPPKPREETPDPAPAPAAAPKAKKPSKAKASSKTKSSAKAKGAAPKAAAAAKRGLLGRLLAAIRSRR